MGKVTDILNARLLRDGKITQAQFDKAQTKETEIKEVVEECKKSDKVKASKTDFKKMLDKLTQ